MPNSPPFRIVTITEKVIKSRLLRPDYALLVELRQLYPEIFDTLKPGWTALIEYKDQYLKHGIIFVNSLNRIYNTQETGWITSDQFICLIVRLYYIGTVEADACRKLSDAYRWTPYVRLVLKMDNFGDVRCDYTVAYIHNHAE